MAMKQIKTIIKRRDYERSFDDAVNLALAQGWTLTRRYVSPGHDGPGSSVVFYPVLVAELERELPASPELPKDLNNE